MLNFNYDFIVETNSSEFAIGDAFIVDIGKGAQYVQYFQKYYHIQKLGILHMIKSY